METVLHLNLSSAVFRGTGIILVWVCRASSGCFGSGSGDCQGSSGGEGRNSAAARQAAGEGSCCSAFAGANPC